MQRAFFLTIVASTFCLLGRASGQEAQASLSSTATTVGQPVQYELKVSGARSASVPESIAVDGLEIRHVGQSTQVQMNNFNVTSSVVHTYLVIPQRAGRFVIPAQNLDAAGRRISSNPVTLTVEAGSGGRPQNPAASGSSADAKNGDKFAFAELIVPKQTAYVGEAVPIEVRVYFDSRVRVRGIENMVLKGEGYTTQKFPEPRQGQVERNGRSYNIVTYKTAITPAKVGKLTVGPGELNCVAQVPRQRRPRLGVDDFFNDDLFNDPFGAFAVNQQITVRSEETALEVKALPRENQPPNFSGAVGQFDLDTRATPSKVKTGDPVKVTIKINGRGNFDRVNSPQIAEESGWRSYPPSGVFKADDDVGISGVKTFEVAIVADEPKTKLPEVEFSYFDPVAEKYVTKKGGRLPISVEGNAALVSASPNSSRSALASPAPSPERVADIHYLRTDSRGWGKDFGAIYEHRAFWLAQLVPAAGMLAFIGFQVIGRRRRKAAASEAKLRQEKQEMLKRLQGRDLSESESFEAARNFLQADTALVTGMNRSTIDAEIACNSRALDEKTCAEIQEIFRRVDESRYAGTLRETSSFPDNERNKLLETLKAFDGNHA
jgi:hypothetical protein